MCNLSCEAVDNCVFVFQSIKWNTIYMNKNIQMLKYEKTFFGATELLMYSYGDKDSYNYCMN